jgi:hypothetical protein
MIEGLKITINGEELQALLAQRMEEHERRAARWKREQGRTPEEETVEEPLLPAHICENAAARHEWRADVLGFIREHIDASEVYRLGAADLEFAELLPEKPGCMEQEEYEAGASIGVDLTRLSKTLGEVVPHVHGVQAPPTGAEER